MTKKKKTSGSHLREPVEQGKRTWVCLLRSLRADATGKARKRTRVNDRAEKPTPFLSCDARLLQLILTNRSSLLYGVLWRSNKIFHMYLSR